MIERRFLYLQILDITEGVTVEIMNSRNQFTYSGLLIQSPTKNR